MNPSMIVPTRIQHDQAKLLRWKLGTWLSTATRSAFTRIIRSHTEQAELCSDRDVAMLEGLIREWNALGSVTQDIEVADGPPTDDPAPPANDAG
jgi:hypothetical protein